MPAEAAASVGQWMEGTWPKGIEASWPTLRNAHFFALNVALFVPGIYFLKSSDPVHLPTVKARECPMLCQEEWGLCREA